MADSTKPEEHEESNAVFEPVIRLTEQIESKTHEEDEDIIFKMRAKLFRFDSNSTEWKERGTGEVRLLSHKETKKVRVLMRREQTHKVCANHYNANKFKEAFEAAQKNNAEIAAKKEGGSTEKAEESKKEEETSDETKPDDAAADEKSTKEEEKSSEPAKESKEDDSKNDG
ncbi:hypothetical protein FRC03_001688 [Tulasnella sp. 419]|nr:hypothetical protein FRC03_001688 [Tulasnella sp. 419]